MTKYKDVYGKYSIGSGAILSNGDEDKVWDRIDEPEVISAYKRSIVRDFVKSGISLKELPQWNIMDVGTGRQAITMLDLGAKKVEHYDISPENVDRLNKYCTSNGLEGRLKTNCCDIVETYLGSEKYDFIYLNGIVQHFSNVGKGIENCIKALKNSGLIWLYFYRSGTYDNFLLYMIRDLIHSSNISNGSEKLKEHFISSIISYSEDVDKNYLTSMYIDGIFTRYANLYTPETYINFMKERGFEVVSSSGLDPLGKNIDHYYARAATVITFRKSKKINDLNSLTNTLSPENDVNQLEKSLYLEQEIVETIELYSEMKRLLSNPNVPQSLTVFVSLRLFNFLNSKIRSEKHDPMNRHIDLQHILRNINKLVKEEYIA
ncbi:MAG: hypothetical protein CMO05_04810 [Thalassospira sp.]|uniref:class I SAM-dependent methyltransferase n=1 Tax=Thalassospira sp. GB04J01 TaxID=1485225 RepID=UPI000C10C799|nr:class I SAM-dependent methyltransferase [Thalassospira sp. GB04J01]MBV16779.1 hypothetical protein [Thalassospira sp.]|tara:strand:+ start:9826 stop:10953 length:1128 start_codon:yes stop_codon:yes gene_type:complete